MSRIGKKPISLPANVNVSITPDSVVTVNGPKGSLSQLVDSDIKINVLDNEIVLERPTDQKRHKSLHGLYRSLINNMIIGVSTGYKTELEMYGVGYKASMNNDILELSLGYSHAIYMTLPSEVKVVTLTEKGQNPKIIIECIDKELLGLVAAKIKSLRKIEPYKGKGINNIGKVGPSAKRKAGKQAAKK